MPSAKIFPNIISLNAAIAACEKGNQWLLALQFLSPGPRGHQLRPDVISYSSCLSACATLGQWLWALEVYGRMGQEMDVISCNAAGILEWFFGGCGWSSQQSSQQIRGSVE